MTLVTYITRQLSLALAFALGGIGFVVFPAITVSAVHKLPGVPVDVLLGFIPFLGVDLVPFLLPMGYLLAVVATFGRLAADNEWTAIKMAGIHPSKLLLPPLIIGVFLGLGTDWVVTTLSPAWKHGRRNYINTARADLIRELNPGVTRLKVGRFELSALGREDDTFLHTHIKLESEEAEDLWIKAERARFGFDGNVLVVDFVNVWWVKGAQAIKVEHPQVRIPLDRLFADNESDRARIKYQSNAEIAERLRSGELPPGKVPEALYEMHRRHALSATFLVFLLLGVPTGIWLRSSTQLGAFAAAVVYATVYYVLSLQLGRYLALNEIVSPVLAAWAVDVLGVALGGILVVRLFRE